MSGTQDYIVNSSGWIAGRWRVKDSTVSLSPGAAKYENVTAKPKGAAKPRSGGKPKSRSRDTSPLDKGATGAAIADAQTGDPDSDQETK